MQIIPAILEENFAEVEKKLKVCQGIFGLAQIDICDGIFIKNTSWQNANDLKAISSLPDIEIHLMVKRPQEVISQWSLEKVKRIIFHLEAALDYLSVLNLIKKLGKQTGLAINPSTPLTELKDISGRLINEVLFLGVEPGFQGQEFQISVIEKIKQFKKLFPEIKIGVDGGVNPSVSRPLIDAGVDYLVVGSYFWKNLVGYSTEEQKVRIKKLIQTLK